MALVQRHKLNGLNLRASDINRDPLSASDLQNVELSNKREIVKRKGYDKVLSKSGVIDSQEYVRGNELVLFSPSKIETLDVENNKFLPVNFGGSVPSAYTEQLDFAEYNGVLYWTDPSGNNELFKYDGGIAYRAGVPQPDASPPFVLLSPPTVPNGVFFRYFFVFFDHRGNKTMGDFIQYEADIGFQTSTIQQPSNGFHEKYGTVDGLQTINAGNLILTVLAGHNYVKDDVVLLTKDPDGELNGIRIISVTGLTITFNSDDIGTESYTRQNTDSVEIRTMILIYASNNKTFGYELAGVNFDLNKVSGPANVVGNIGLLTPDSPMEDLYDTTVLKGLPPKTRHISMYRNTMILANRVDFLSGSSGLQTDEPNTIYWSDTGVGSTVETFPPFSHQSIGRTDEGDITGVFASSDNFIVFKERQVYYGNGILIGRDFRTRSALTNGVGCISHKSIYEVQGGSIFMSSRGLYLANYGNKPVELSDVIEPYFNANRDGLDFTKAVTVNDIKNEKLLIFVPALKDSDCGTVIIYDYYYQQWFLHRGIDARAGISFLGKELYHLDGTNIYKRSECYNDNGKSINAYWKSNWEDLGFPSVTKKFLKMIIISIGSLVWKAKVRSQKNWDESKNITDQVVSFDKNVHVHDKSLNMAQPYSMRMEIGNNVCNEGILVTGIEFTHEMTQTSPKGND